MPPTLTRLIISDKIISYMHAMQQTNAATNATNKPDSILPILPLALTRASYSQTCSDTKPVAPRLRENRNAPYSNPEIEEKSSAIRHCLA